MSVIAKLLCTEVNLYEAYQGIDEDGNTKPTATGARVKLMAVVSQSEGDVNEAWAAATPSGELTMQIDNPVAAAQFTPGKYWLVSMQEVSDG
jgi:hypothetical protein